MVIVYYEKVSDTFVVQTRLKVEDYWTTWHDDSRDHDSPESAQAYIDYASFREDREYRIVHRVDTVVETV